MAREGRLCWNCTYNKLKGIEAGVCEILGVDRKPGAVEITNAESKCHFRHRGSGKIEQSQIDAALKKQLTAPVRKPVDNLLCLVFTINRDTGKVLDVVSKPSICNDNLTGYPQSSMNEHDMIITLRKRGYRVAKIET